MVNPDLLAAHICLSIRISAFPVVQGSDVSTCHPKGGHGGDTYDVRAPCGIRQTGF